MTIKPASPIKLNFIHVNDTHGIVEPIRDGTVSEDSLVGGLARLKTAIDGEKAANPDGSLVLHAGDHAEGSMVSYLSRGEVVKKATDGWFDAICPGNHDHAWGQETMAELFDNGETANLCANIRPLPGFEPYQIFERQGVKIGVIGVNTPELRHYVHGSKLEGLDIEDPVVSLERHLPEMKKDGAEVIVVLSHTGFEQPDPTQASDLTMARALAARHQQDPDFPKVDLIVGGHTHSRLEQGHEECGTLIVQAGGLTHYVGNAELTFDPTSRKVIGHQARILPVVADQVAPDPTVENILAPYLSEAAEVGSRPMGQAEQPLRHGHREAAKLNQIHADSLLEKTDAELVVCNSRTLRSDVPAGEVSYAQLYTALPFTEDLAVTITATGKMVRAILEDGVNDGARELAIPAGLRYTYDPGLPQGQRVTGVELADGQTLQDDREYRVGMNWTMSNHPCWDGSRDMKVHGSCQELFLEAFQQGGPWRDDPDDRVSRA